MAGQIKIKRKSAWTWNTSGTGGASLGFVAASGGDIVLNDPGGAVQRFRFAAGGLGLGIGLKRIPKLGRIDTRGLSERGGGNVAPEFFTNHGTILVADGCPTDDLGIDDFRGVCLNYDAGGGLIVGYAGTVFIINVNPLAVAANANAVTSMLGPPLQPHAIVLAHGWNAGPQASAGISASIGYMWRPR